MSAEEEQKITITLSKKGLETLDELKEMSGFGSRGRTVEEAVLAIKDFTVWIKFYSQAIAKLDETKKFDYSKGFFSLLLQATQILSRFGYPRE